MPMYEYRCENGHVTEKLHKPTPISHYIYCADCGHQAPRIWSRVNHMFTGFLREDFWDDWEKNTPGDYHEERGDRPKYGVGI